MLKKLFHNRFCWDWCSSIAILATIAIFNPHKWWQIVIALIFIVFGYLIPRYFAFKYFDE